MNASNPILVPKPPAPFEVAPFEVGSDATLKIGEELKPEAQAKPLSSMKASLALQASMAGHSADLSSNSATSKLTLRVSEGWLQWNLTSEREFEEFGLNGRIALRLLVAPL